MTNYYIITLYLIFGLAIASNWFITCHRLARSSRRCFLPAPLIDSSTKQFLIHKMLSPKKIAKGRILAPNEIQNRKWRHWRSPPRSLIIGQIYMINSSMKLLMESIQILSVPLYLENGKKETNLLAY